MKGALSIGRPRRAPEGCRGLPRAAAGCRGLPRAAAKCLQMSRYGLVRCRLLSIGLVAFCSVLSLSCVRGQGKAPPGGQLRSPRVAS
jgi:hypothetical protein